MAAVPGISEEDAKRPDTGTRELVAERTRLVNRMKAALARLGIRDVNPALRKTASRLDALRTPEGANIPDNALAEMRRDIVRLRLVEDQIAEIERGRLQRLAERKAQDSRADAMVHQLSRIVGVGVETADMLVQEVLLRDLRDRRAVARYAGLTGSPDESGTRAASADCHVPAMPGSAGAWSSWPGDSLFSKRRAPWWRGTESVPPTGGLEREWR